MCLAICRMYSTMKRGKEALFSTMHYLTGDMGVPTVVSSQNVFCNIYAECSSMHHVRSNGCADGSVFIESAAKYVLHYAKCVLLQTTTWGCQRQCLECAAKYVECVLLQTMSWGCRRQCLDRMRCKMPTTICRMCSPHRQVCRVRRWQLLWLSEFIAIE